MMRDPHDKSIGLCAGGMTWDGRSRNQPGHGLGQFFFSIFPSLEYA
jgi:hypothetical protein